MKILYIYRNPNKGFSIGKVMKPIENKIAETDVVEAFVLPRVGATFIDLFINVKALLKFIHGKKIDIYHITGDCYYLAYFLPQDKTIATVHDLGFYTNHKDRKIRSFLLYWLWIKPLLKCGAVTCISEKSKQEAQNLLQFNSTQLITIPNACPPSFKKFDKNFNTEKPCFLHLGTKPNKNLPRVIEALDGFDCHLRIIGSITEEIITLLTKHKVDYSCDCNLTDDQILQEYNKCDVVSFPSLYEGFGMMVIEGQTVGRVVVTSNVSPMKEIAGGGAVIVDPNSVASIREGFIEAINNHEHYVEIGFGNVKKYNIDAIAQKYMNLYKKMTSK